MEAICSFETLLRISETMRVLDPDERAEEKQDGVGKRSVACTLNMCTPCL